MAKMQASWRVANPRVKQKGNVHHTFLSVVQRRIRLLHQSFAEDWARLAKIERAKRNILCEVLRAKYKAQYQQKWDLERVGIVMAEKIHWHLQHHRGVQETEGHLMWCQWLGVIVNICIWRSHTVTTVVWVLIVIVRSTSHHLNEGCSPLWATCRWNC
jgi:hypothetical protein